MAILMASTATFSQIEAGIRVGLSSIDIADDLSSTQLIGDRFTTISPTDAEYGYHFGLYARASFAGLYLEPAILFNSSSISYRIQQLGEEGATDIILSETYRNVDVPVMVGVRALRICRLYGGPVARFHLDSSSDLLSLDGYQRNFESSTFGFRVGTGIDIWRLRIDLAYEGSLSGLGDHITIGGTDLSFDDNPGRALGSVSWKF